MSTAFAHAGLKEVVERGTGERAHSVASRFFPRDSEHPSSRALTLGGSPIAPTEGQNGPLAPAKRYCGRKRESARTSSMAVVPAVRSRRLQAFLHRAL